MTIRCKLDELLRRHGKTIQQVHLDTHIARSVLTEMRDNQRKRYDAAVMNKLCNYFRCPISALIESGPDEFPAVAEDAPPADPPT